VKVKIKKLTIIDEKSRSSIFRISKNYGFHKFLNKQYKEESEKDYEKNEDENPKEMQNLEDIEKNLKEFCVDMESLCEKYEKEIVKYKKNVEELQKNNTSNTRKTSNASDIKNEISTFGLVEKCDASINTDDFSIGDVREILIKIDNNLIVEHKSKIFDYLNKIKFFYLIF